MALNLKWTQHEMVQPVPLVQPEMARTWKGLILKSQPDEAMKWRSVGLKLNFWTLNQVVEIFLFLQ